MPANPLTGVETNGLTNFILPGLLFFCGRLLGSWLLHACKIYMHICIYKKYVNMCKCSCTFTTYGL